MTQRSFLSFAAFDGIAPALRGGAMAFDGIAPAPRGGAMSFNGIAPALRGGAMAVLLALAAGCGSYPPPTERLTTAEAAIRGAEEVGASRVPRAALHLQLAQEQTEKAKRLMQDGYNERAELTLKRAQADAELAIAISKEHETVQRAQQAQAKLEQVKAASKKGAQ